MATRHARTHKHFRLNPTKIKRAQRVLKAATETETIERALEFVIAEDERSRLTLDVNQRFASSGIEIADAYGVLDA